MERREFLKAIALAGVAATIKISNPLSVLAQSGQNLTTGLPYDLVAVMGGEPVEMFRRAMTEMGGMEKFVKAGQKVVVKPNIGWDKTPELAGNTNPDLVAEIIRQCFAAGAKEVVVFDHTCDDWRKCYKNSGIEEAAEAAGAKGNESRLHHTDSNPPFRLQQKFSPILHQPAIVEHNVKSYRSLPGPPPTKSFFLSLQTGFLPANEVADITVFERHPVDSVSTIVSLYLNAD